jgi:hypothetical protein
MAKKQTRRSISVSLTTYERLKAFCESNNISMSQFVETRVGDFLGGSGEATTTVIPATPRPSITPTTSSTTSSTGMGPAPAKPANPIHKPETRPATPAQVPMTSAAARFAVEPPPPVIKPKQEQPAPKPVEKKAEQIFTF